MQWFLNRLLALSGGAEMYEEHEDDEDEANDAIWAQELLEAY
jgi:hypothetical protein